MAFKTRITEMFGIETPIVMGGMTGVGYGELVAAVANAGALGFITAHMYPTGQALFDEIEATRKRTDKPFGVNLTLLPSINPIPYDDYREAIIASGIKIVETAGRAPTDHLPRLLPTDVLYACGAPGMVDSIGSIAASVGAVCYADPFLPTTGDAVKESVLTRAMAWLALDRPRYRREQPMRAHRVAEERGRSHYRTQRA